MPCAANWRGGGLAHFSVQRKIELVARGYADQKLVGIAALTNQAAISGWSGQARIFGKSAGSPVWSRLPGERTTSAD